MLQLFWALEQNNVALCKLPSLKSPSDIIYMSRNTTFQLSSSYKTPLVVRLVAAETKKFVPPLLEINSPFPILVLLLYSLYNKSQRTKERRCVIYMIQELDRLNIDAYHEIVECITSALDARDPYTAGHSERVSDLAQMICGEMGITGECQNDIHVAAHLHDIGKIGIPDAVLNKPERLTDEEWEIMKEHPAIGAEILSKSSMLSGLIDIVLHHHERFDGKGYPDGLKGAEISVGARIIAICDSIDAMTSTRRYRKALGFDICYQEIEKNLGKMYDPVIGRFVLDNWDKVITVLQKKETNRR